MPYPPVAVGDPSKLVLGVDDLPENLLFLRANLLVARYRFVGAASGAACLEILTRETPQLILLDVQMPEIDGFEVCRAIRRNPAFRDIPIAFLTAHNGPDDIERGLAAGGNDFITKPFNPVTLIERVAHWTGRAPQGGAPGAGSGR